MSIGLTGRNIGRKQRYFPRILRPLGQKSRDEIWKSNIQAISDKTLNNINEKEFLVIHCKGVGDGQGPTRNRARVLLVEDEQQRIFYSHAKDEVTGWIYVDVFLGKFGKSKYAIVNVLMKAYGDIEFDDVRTVNWE
jgi:hypothetical protein